MALPQPTNSTVTYILCTTICKHSQATSTSRTAPLHQSLPTCKMQAFAASLAVLPTRPSRAPRTRRPRMSIEYGAIQHIGLLVASTARAKAFYTDVLGMADDEHLRNPALPFGGTFVRAGDSQIHLMELPSPDPTTGRPEHGGRDRHAAVTVRDLAPLVESLERHGVQYTKSKSGRRAVFTRDLDANALEFVEVADM